MYFFLLKILGELFHLGGLPTTALNFDGGIQQFLKIQPVNFVLFRCLVISFIFRIINILCFIVYIKKLLSACSLHN